MRDPRPAGKRRKPWSKLSPTYRKRLLAKRKGVYKAYGKAKPKGGRGRAAVKRLGRKYKTGMFSKIAKKAARRYGSAAAGRRVAGKIYQLKVRKVARRMAGR